VPALLRFLSLLFLLFITPVQAAGLPGLLGSSAPAQPEATEPLGKSLDEVIKNLENDQQRAKLLADLKKLRDATRQTQPSVEQGVLGLIGGALSDFEKQFSGDASPFHRWAAEIEQAQVELTELMVPVHQWPAILFGFAAVIAVWSLLAYFFNWVGHRIRLRFGLSEELPQHPRTWDLVRFALPVRRQVANGGRLRLAGRRTAVFRKEMLTHRRDRKRISLQKYIAWLSKLPFSASPWVVNEQ
jgi:small conductance mechanosensitive channel